MTEGENSKRYDFEERALRFALRVRAFLKTLRRTVANQEDGRQLIKASGSIGANYIEANEALGKKDFVMRLRIARKEAKESRFFLRLLDTDGRDGPESDRKSLIKEAGELLLILSAMIRNSE
jgi:four helix bundle protein